MSARTSRTFQCEWSGPRWFSCAWKRATANRPGCAPALGRKPAGLPKREKTHGENSLRRFGRALFRLGPSRFAASLAFRTRGVWLSDIETADWNTVPVSSMAPSSRSALARPLRSDPAAPLPAAGCVMSIQARMPCPPRLRSRRAARSRWCDCGQCPGPSRESASHRPC